MALITQSFAEHYAELVARVPTHTELLLDVQRREVGERKTLEEKCQMAFRDVLHVAAVMISDKKLLGKMSLAHRNRFEVALHRQKTAVWFPATPPRPVAFPTGRLLLAFPHAAFSELCAEERELRQWLYGVERRLREHIEEACGRAWLFLNFIGDVVSRESLSRQRVQYEEDEAFNSVKKCFFRAVPPEYYRFVVITRYGRTASANEQVKDLSFEEIEQEARAGLMEEEEASRRSVFQYLHDMYDLQLFALNHREITTRYELEEEECNSLFPLVAQCCRDDFGIVFYHVPALALHFSSSFPCMRALCTTQLQEAPRRTAATKARFSWVPAQLLASMGKEVEVEEEPAEGQQGGADSCVSADNAPSPAVDADDLPVLEQSAPATPVEETQVEETPEADGACLHVLSPDEGTEAHSPVIDEGEEARVPEDNVSASRSDKSSELILTPQLPPRSLLVAEELALGTSSSKLHDRKLSKKASQ